MAERPLLLRLRVAGMSFSGALWIGCGTIVSGTSADVRLTSRPAGASVTVRPGGLAVTTPATVELSNRKGPYLLTFELEGYEAQRAYISAQGNPWLYGNILFGGVPGILVDWLTGGYLRLVPTEIDVELYPKPPTKAEE